MKYRPEIDGLRAVAVLPVILFHAGFPAFAGGYVGVDVFFVISGYLITTILIGEREAGTYSLLGFYERRARRILPALFVVLACTTPFAWRWLTPEAFADYARSEAFAAMFISNVHFIEYSSYYDIESSLRPLLHTWSLAVEEQYYLLFPLVLLPLGAFVRRRFAVVFLILAALSLALAEWGWRNYPSENFYFTFSRLWEILAGSICAVILFARPRMQNDVLGLIGLALILYSIFFYSAAVPFPSVYTLVPVVGAALIILYADRGTWVARMLSTAPMIWIGLLSYSAYLWHQPLFAFARIRSIGAPSLWLMAGLSVVTLLLAYLTMKFVETPTRHRRLLSGRWSMLGTSAAVIAAIAAFGLTGKNNGGFPDRVREEVPGYLTALRDDQGAAIFDGGCAEGIQPDGSHFCEIFATDAPGEEVGVLGDSHANAILPAFRDLAEARHVQVLRAASTACPPLLGVYRAYGGSLASKCHDFAEGAAREAVDRGLGTVFLAGRWSLYATGAYGEENPTHALGPSSGVQSIGREKRRLYFRQAVERTVAFYTDTGIDVYLVEEVPLQRAEANDLVARAILLGLDLTEAQEMFANSYVSKAQAETVQEFSNDVLADIARSSQAVMVSTARRFLVDDEYPWLAGDHILYFDADHLSVNGARGLQSVVSRAYAAPPSGIGRQ